MSEYVMVPREPTEAMIDAYFDVCSRHGFRAHINASCAWQSMIKVAALSAPAPSQGAGIGQVMQELVQELAPDQGETASRAFGLAVRLQALLEPRP